MKFNVLLLICLFTFNSAMASVVSTNPPKKTLRHIVMFKFKDSASDAEVKEVEDAFRNLPSKIKEIKDFEWGTNNSPEGLEQGFTHVFLVTFDSEEGREIYLPHPAHKNFISVLEPHMEKALVVDYWSKD